MPAVMCQRSRSTHVRIPQLQSHAGVGLCEGAPRAFQTSKGMRSGAEYTRMPDDMARSSVVSCRSTLTSCTGPRHAGRMGKQRRVMKMQSSIPDCQPPLWRAAMLCARMALLQQARFESCHNRESSLRGMHRFHSQSLWCAVSAYKAVHAPDCQGEHSRLRVGLGLTCPHPAFLY